MLPSSRSDVAGVHTDLVFVAFSVGVCLLSVIVVLGCTRLPAPDAQIDGDEIVVDVQFLGEYPSPVSRIRLTDLATGSTVWEVDKLGEGVPQMRRVILTVGTNPILPETVEGEGFRVVHPQSKSFQLEAGRRYKIHLLGFEALVWSIPLVRPFATSMAN